MSEPTSNNPPTKLEVEIHNLVFRLRAPEEDHDRLRRAAKRVDDMLRGLAESSVTPDTAKLAIQAALLATVEYYKVIDDATAAIGLTDDIQRRIDNLIDILDQELNTIG